MTANIIDTHAHIIGDDALRYPVDPLGGVQSGWSRERPINCAQMIAAMDEAGIARTVLVQAGTCHGYDNSYVAHAIERHPGRFTGVMCIDVFAQDAAGTMRMWMSRGFTGLRLFTAGSTMAQQADWLSDPRTYPIWELASELDFPICVQMRTPGIPMLHTLLERFRTVPVLIDHLMRPALEDGPPYAAADGLLALAQYANVNLKLTTLAVRDANKGQATPESFFRRVVDAFGAQRIAWGSDCPQSIGRLADLLSESRRALDWLPASAREQIFSGTAKRLYPVLAGI